MVKVPMEFDRKPNENWKVIAFVVGHDGYSSGCEINKTSRR